MTKFQKIQKISSIIPFFSSILVFFATIFELKRQKASVKRWILFFLIFFSSCVAVYFINTAILSGRLPIFNLIASGLLFALANILCVDLQVYQPNETSKKKNFIISTIIFFGLAGVIILIGLVSIAFSVLFSSADFADPNGAADTSIATITVSDVLDTKNVYKAFYSVLSYDGNHSYVPDDFEDFDRDICRYQAKKIQGILLLQATRIKQNTLTLHIDSSLTEGNLEIFVIVDGEVYERLPANISHSITVGDVSGKLVVVKLATEAAACSVSVSREYQ